MIQPSKTTSMGSTDLFCFQLVTHPLSPRDNLRLRPMFFSVVNVDDCVDANVKNKDHLALKIEGWCICLSKVKGFYYLLLLITSSKDASPTCQEHSMVSDSSFRVPQPSFPTWPLSPPHRYPATSPSGCKSFIHFLPCWYPVDSLYNIIDS